jgi:hypothetical protein
VVLIGGPLNESADEIAAPVEELRFRSSVRPRRLRRRRKLRALRPCPGFTLAQAMVPPPGMMDARRPMPMNERRW